MSERPNTSWNLLDRDGKLSPAWGTAYTVQQLTIAVMNVVEELRRIRRDMPISDEARIVRERVAAEQKAEDELDQRVTRVWMHTQGIGANRLRRLMCEAERHGIDVCGEAGARATVESYRCTEKQQASILAWWARKYPNTVPPLTQLRQKPNPITNDAEMKGDAQ